MKLYWSLIALICLGIITMTVLIFAHKCECEELTEPGNKSGGENGGGIDDGLPDIVNSEDCIAMGMKNEKKCKDSAERESNIEFANYKKLYPMCVKQTDSEDENAVNHTLTIAPANSKGNTEKVAAWGPNGDIMWFTKQHCELMKERILSDGMLSWWLRD